jgi:hypothetical protein
VVAEVVVGQREVEVTAGQQRLHLVLGRPAVDRQEGTRRLRRITLPLQHVGLHQPGPVAEHGVTDPFGGLGGPGRPGQDDVDVVSLMVLQLVQLGGGRTGAGAARRTGHGRDGVSRRVHIVQIGRPPVGVQHSADF